MTVGARSFRRARAFQQQVRAKARGGGGTNLGLKAFCA